MQSPRNVLPDEQGETLARFYRLVLSWPCPNCGQPWPCPCDLAEKLPALDSIPRAETPPEEGLPHES
jgi:hypothetical protein